LVNFYLTGNDELHDRIIKALYDGCPEQKNLRSVQDYEPSEIAVVFGVYKKAVAFSRHRGHVISSQTSNKGRTIVLETGYVNRGDGENNHYAAGFDGLNGRADFRNFTCPKDRWEKLDIHFAPWRDRGDHILLCGQVPWDASVDSSNHYDWIEQAVSRIRKFSDRKIVFRPHPKAPDYFIHGVEYSRKPIQEDFKNCWAVVTFNSNSAVEAVIAGVPAFVEDMGSMAYPVANRNLIYLDDPKTPKRDQWAYNLAYCQWTPEEMRSGETWRHLLR
jgi:hypothetical protein